MPAPLSPILRLSLTLSLFLSLSLSLSLSACDADDGGSAVCKCGANETCSPDNVCVCAVGFHANEQGACQPDETSTTSDFEDVALSEAGVWIGADGSGGVATGLAFFSNLYNEEYESWEGFAVSNHKDTATPGFENQYSAWPGSGNEGSSTYAVVYVGFSGPPTITFPDAPTGVRPQGVFVANTTYAALSMRDGDAYAKKFGGVDGTDPDWFLLTFTGHDSAGAPAGEATVYFADFRSADASSDHIEQGWTWVDLSGLGTVSSVTLAFTSSDMGDFGMNTPGYVALDDLVVAPAP